MLQRLKIRQLKNAVEDRILHYSNCNAITECQAENALELLQKFDTEEAIRDTATYVDNCVDLNVIRSDLKADLEGKYKEEAQKTLDKLTFENFRQAYEDYYRQTRGPPKPSLILTVVFYGICATMVGGAAFEAISRFC